MLCEKLGFLFFVSSPNGFELLLALQAERASGQVSQSVARQSDARGNIARRIDNVRSIEDRVEQRCFSRASAPSIRLLDLVPVAVGASRERLADSRRPIAEADVAVAAARVAELSEAPVFECFDDRRLLVIRFCNA